MVSKQEYIKVNIPRTKEDFNSGAGEGCWVLVDNNTKEKYDNGAEDGTYYGILDNDSFYYPDLKSGTEITFTMRGDNRPVVFIDGCLDKYNPISDEEFSTLLEKIRK